MDCRFGLPQLFNSKAKFGFGESSPNQGSGDEDSGDIADLDYSDAVEGCPDRGCW